MRILLQMISTLLQITLFLDVTYDKYAKRNFTICQLDTHGNVLKALMSLFVA